MHDGLFSKSGGTRSGEENNLLCEQMEKAPFGGALNQYGIGVCSKLLKWRMSGVVYSTLGTWTPLDLNPNPYPPIILGGQNELGRGQIPIPPYPQPL